MPTSTKCEFCDKLLTTVYTKGSYHFFQCKECNKKFSLRKNTFLSNANISLRKFILLVYIFVANFWTYKDIQKETNLSSTDEENSDNEDGASSSTHLGKATISKYFTFFRSVWMCVNISYVNVQIAIEMLLVRKCFQILSIKKLVVRGLR